MQESNLPRHVLATPCPIIYSSWRRHWDRGITAHTCVSKSLMRLRAAWARRTNKHYARISAGTDATTAATVLRHCIRFGNVSTWRTQIRRDIVSYIKMFASLKVSDSPAKHIRRALTVLTPHLPQADWQTYFNTTDFITIYTRKSDIAEHEPIDCVE